MKVIVSGSTGLVGSALMLALEEAGHEPVRLVRRAATENDIHWDPKTGKIDTQRLEGADAVVHLAGENIASGRWTEARKARFRDSRVDGTRLICETLASLERKPATLISASATGYYGDRADDVCNESSGTGEGFLPDLCREWEAATEAAANAGIRVVNLRIGMVLSTKDGALAKMLRPFRFGLGGVVGSGRQYWSWISLPDLIRVILFTLAKSKLSGPVNAVAPIPVTNQQFTKSLGQALGRPTIFPLPAIVARLILGEMADALLLASARVVPKQLLDAGFSFSHDELSAALQAVLHET